MHKELATEIKIIVMEMTSKSSAGSVFVEKCTVRGIALVFVTLCCILGELTAGCKNPSAAKNMKNILENLLMLYNCTLSVVYKFCSYRELLKTH